jgi:hypothetical protein
VLHRPAAAFSMGKDHVQEISGAARSKMHFR